MLPDAGVKLVRSGVTRRVVLTKRWAIKLARGYRGILANESEWRQRRRPQVNRPLFDLLHVVQVSRRADHLAGPNWSHELLRRHSGDEEKPSSWGNFNGQWLLIDFDRAWEQPRSLLARPYYARQERLARRWSRLPASDAS